MNTKIISFAVTLLFVASCSLSATPSETPTYTPTAVPSETPASTPTVTPNVELNYSFSLDSEIVDVIWNNDGSLTLSYEFTFTNDNSGSPIDFVDVYIPSQDYNLQNIAAEVDHFAILHIDESSFFPGAIELGLNQYAIPPGDTGNVSVQIYQIRDVLYLDPEDDRFVSAVFFPNWFDQEFTHGTTDITVIFHLPPGVQPTETRWHQSPPDWPEEPISGVDELERITYTWNNPNANGYTQYLFGVSFPKIHILETAVVLPGDLDVMFAEAFNNRGMAYFLELDYDSAIADFTQAIILNPRYTEAYNNRGNAFALSDLYDQALVDLNEAIEISPQFAPTYHNRGLTYMLMLHYDEALADLNIANELDPLFANTYYLRGFLYYEIEEMDKAISDLERALELGLDPNVKQIAEALLEELGQ